MIINNQFWQSFMASQIHCSDVSQTARRRDTAASFPLYRSKKEKLGQELPRYVISKRLLCHFRYKRGWLYRGSLLFNCSFTLYWCSKQNQKLHKYSRKSSTIRVFILKVNGPFAATGSCRNWSDHAKNLNNFFVELLLFVAGNSVGPWLEQVLSK